MALWGLVRDREAKAPRQGGAYAAADLCVRVFADMATDRFVVAGADEIRRFIGLDAGVPVPPGERARRSWIGEQVALAFRTPGARRAYRFDTLVEQAVTDELCDQERLGHLLTLAGLATRNEQTAITVCRRLARLAATGIDAMRRIEAEVVQLDGMADGYIHRRLSIAPATRFDAVPPGGPARRAWIREMLVGEAVAIGAGMIAPEAVARIARAARFPVAETGAEERAAISFPAWHPSRTPLADATRQAPQLANLDDARLSQRFAAVPGWAVPSREPKRRIGDIARALQAELVRRAAGLDQGRQGAAVELGDITAGVDGGSLRFTGVLALDGEALCRVTGHGGAIEASDWAAGCGSDDLELLDLHLAATTPPRDDGTPNSLAMVLLDQVSAHLAAEAYRRASSDQVLFVVEGEGGPELLAIAIPEGGSREGALDALRTARPDAAPLALMPEEDAVLVWTMLAS